MSEPAILVRRLTGSQVWSMEKLENKLIDMREMYQEYKDHPMTMVSLFISFVIAYFTAQSLTSRTNSLIIPIVNSYPHTHFYC